MALRWGDFLDRSTPGRGTTSVLLPFALLHKVNIKELL